MMLFFIFDFFKYIFPIFISNLIFHQLSNYETKRFRCEMKPKYDF